MKALPIAFALVILALPCLAQEGVKSEKRAVRGEPKQAYFLIHDGEKKAPRKGYKLLIVMPGGDGSANFNPFVTNLRKQVLGDDYLVAQLVSVKWTPGQTIVWPTKRSRSAGMKFTTEEFIAAVIADIKRDHKLDADHVYTLSWSSSGPAAYAASLTLEAIKGSFIAMSVFKPDFLPSLKKAKGHRFYLYHSPDDKVCPHRMAVDAQEALKKEKAKVKLVSYDGGHGWHGNVFGAIRAGVEWLEKR